MEAKGQVFASSHRGTVHYVWSVFMEGTLSFSEAVLFGQGQFPKRSLVVTHQQLLVQRAGEVSAWFWRGAAHQGNHYR